VSPAGYLEAHIKTITVNIYGFINVGSRYATLDITPVFLQFWMIYWIYDPFKLKTGQCGLQEI